MASAAEQDLAGADEEQRRMMAEEVIVTDYFDRPIGSGSKKETHIMDNINAGMLHRAFSVFLFTPDGKLVLQQRAGTKITFPFIWANTCCSHPLSVQSEMIEADALGVKNAARRKLEHELGIPPEDVPLESFTWITRVHYVGASVGGPWGEHEIDWILLCAPPVMPRLELNLNEVAQVRAFSQAELREWMATRPQHGSEVSPWFAVMEASGLVYRWWDAVLDRDVDSVLERAKIHRQNELEAIVEGVPSKPLPPAFDACLQATYARDQRRRRHVGPAESAVPSPEGSGSRSAGRGRAGALPVAAGILAASPVFSAPVALTVGAATAAIGSTLYQTWAAGTGDWAAAFARLARGGCSFTHPERCLPRVVHAWQLGALSLFAAGITYLLLAVLLPLLWRAPAPPAVAPAAEQAPPAAAGGVASEGSAEGSAAGAAEESVPPPSPLRRRSSRTPAAASPANNRRSPRSPSAYEL